MVNTSASRLSAVHDLTTLITYLREELQWPIAEGEVEDVTFGYEPHEVGLKDDLAPKVNKIYQLRRIHGNQPWGVFYVDFESKSLPITVMRRILSHLVVKRRQTGNQAQRTAWEAGDLLFITTFGTAGDREIAFARFQEQAGDLPTLKVLGWDGGDTPLKLDHVSQTLHQDLSWPRDVTDLEAWRRKWQRPFRHRLGHVIRTADNLSERLAELARDIRDRCRVAMAAETENGPLTKLYTAFQTALLHDLKPEDFADTYAQTITYGLLTAAISRTDMQGGANGTALLAEDVAQMVPITNPFLKEMLESFLRVGGRRGGIDFDELGIQEVVELLRGDETDLPAIVRDFGNRKPGEDPVIHFYDHFLASYDKRLKIKRGVFYTPLPVVSYIVRSVHELLQTEFGLEDGLASTVTWGEMAKWNPEIKIPEGTDPDAHFVVILDPAVGTATFLVEVIDVIHHTLERKWTKQGLNKTQRNETWNEYVPNHLLPRLFGYEIMMAPYAIAHMKIGLKLTETGYKFRSKERVRVYLTNALEPATEIQPRLPDLSPALAHEAQSVSVVKNCQVITVAIGNPPYAKLSQNQGRWINELMDRYKVTIRLEEIQRQALSNDYVKFVCFATHVLRISKFFIFGMITDNSYLDGPLFRDMRSDLLSTFPTLRIIDLHGNSRKRAELTLDQNVFDIQQGVAILVGSKGPMTTRSSMLYSSLMGSVQYKTERLVSAQVTSVGFEPMWPVKPNFYFIPRQSEEFPEWATALPLPDLFAGGRRSGRPLPFNGAALATRHDDFAIAFTETELRENLRCFFDASRSNEDLAEKFSFCSTSHFSLVRARRDTTWEEAVRSIQPILYRPFDFRFVVYHPLLIGEPRPEVMRLLLRDNIALLSTRRVTGRPWDNVFITAGLVEYKAATHDRNTQVFPLYLYSTGTDEQYRLGWNDLARTSNFDPATYELWHRSYGLSSPDELLHYTYALLHSPSYRARYQQHLQQDYARVMPPCSAALFRALERMGNDLIDLHLLKSRKLQRPITNYFGTDRMLVKIGGKGKSLGESRDDIGKVHVNNTSGFEGVPQAAWDFHIGGYQVCHKWLDDRRKAGRSLSDEDIEHYHKIVVAVNETIRIMHEIDEVIEQHGGWPGAFSTGERNA